MKTQIENENEFNKTIDQYGEALDKIERLKCDADVLKAALEMYANDNGVRTHATERYELAMKKSALSLRISSDTKEDAVVAALKECEDGTS